MEKDNISSIKYLATGLFFSLPLLSVIKICSELLWTCSEATQASPRCFSRCLVQ